MTDIIFLLAQTSVDTPTLSNLPIRSEGAHRQKRPGFPVFRACRKVYLNDRLNRPEIYLNGVSAHMAVAANIAMHHQVITCLPRLHFDYLRIFEELGS
jgi:hypothetical protein